VSNRLKIIYSDFSCRELSIDLCMGQIGGGGGEGGGAEFFGPPHQKLLGTPTKL